MSSEIGGRILHYFRHFAAQNLRLRRTNPIGSLRTRALLLEHLREKDAALALMQATERVRGYGLNTPGLGGKATTRGITAAVCDAIHNLNA
jgi:tartrate dehydrogenase/decarboxylase/D-malate dehydrogenase